jgi:hypothetical protein
MASGLQLRSSNSCEVNEGFILAIGIHVSELECVRLFSQDGMN